MSEIADRLAVLLSASASAYERQQAAAAIAEAVDRAGVAALDNAFTGYLQGDGAVLGGDESQRFGEGILILFQESSLYSPTRDELAFAAMRLLIASENHDSAQRLGEAFLPFLSAPVQHILKADLGLVATLLGHHAEALGLAKDALGQATVQREPTWILHHMELIATILARSGAFEEALREFDSAIAFAETFAEQAPLAHLRARRAVVASAV